MSSRDRTVRRIPKREAAGCTIGEAIQAGHLNPGWTPENWAARLEQMAELCEPLHPTLAGQLRDWASAVRRKHCPQSSGT